MKEVQVKTVIWYCYTTIKVTKIKRQIISNVDEDVGEVKLIQCSHTLTLKKQFVIFL